MFGFIGPLQIFTSYLPTMNHLKRKNNAENSNMSNKSAKTTSKNNHRSQNTIIISGTLNTVKKYSYLSLKNLDDADSKANKDPPDNVDQDSDDGNDGDAEIVDRTQDEMAKREEAVKKISQCLPIAQQRRYLLCLQGKDLQKWKAPIYTFFGANPLIELGVDSTAEYLVYTCTNFGKKKKQGLKTQDKGLTGQ